MHRRTLSSYIEWAIKASLDTEVVRPTNMPSMVASDTTIGSEAEYLWDVDDADRFVKLAMRYPHLLTHEEQVRWKLIREMPGLWRGHWRGSPKEWHWTVDEDSIVLDQLRAHWMELCAIADGGTPRANLPRWLRVRTLPVESDDDCPF